MTSPTTTTPSSTAQEAVVELRAASFGYGGRPVTSELSLRIAPGEVVALLGPNGSGKSTLVRGMLRLSDHTGGQALLFGTPLARFADRRRIGYVPQRHTLSGSIRSTCREVVATGLLAQRPWWRRAGPADRQAVLDALETVGLLDRADIDVATLSGGQQRRVLIARALVSGPDVLVMDEPTAGVDAASQDVLAGVLRRLAATGVTMLVVTHELAALRGIVDRILELDAGHISFDGSPEAYAEHQAQVARATSSGTHTDHRHDHDGHHHPEDAGPSGRPPLLGTGPLDPRQPGRNGGR